MAQDPVGSCRSEAPWAFRMTGSAELGSHFVTPGEQFGCKCRCSRVPRTFLKSGSNFRLRPQEEAAHAATISDASYRGPAGPFDYVFNCEFWYSFRRLITAVSIIYEFLAKFRPDKEVYSIAKRLAGNLINI